MFVTNHAKAIKNNTGDACRYWTPAYETIIRRIMIGDLKPLLNDLHAEKGLSVAERLELESTVEFQLGRLRPARKCLVVATDFLVHLTSPV